MALGDITTKYETDGVGTSSISNTKGDHGGASYGKFQLSHKMGSLKEFLNLLGQTNPEAYNQLAPLWGSAGSGKAGAFGQKWVELANSGKLQDAETAYAMNNYLKGGLANLRNPELADRIMKSPALQEAFLSTTAQHGPAGGASIWRSAYKQGIGDADLITGVYNERGRANPDGTLVHFRSSSRDVQRGVANRFKKEVNDILGMLGATPTESTPVNPNQSRPSVEPQGFVDPMVAQSVQGQMPVPSTPARQGFVGSVNIPDFSSSLLATVQRNNAELANMTSGMGFTGMRPNLGLG